MEKPAYIHDSTFENERDLYGLCNAEIERCVFAGSRDGESALKESKNIHVLSSTFALRYPLWHVTKGVIEACKLTGTCRAPIWYGQNIAIKKTVIAGIKAIRECNQVSIEQSTIRSDEFGWMSSDLHIRNTGVISEYPFFHSRDLDLQKINLQGKYSFQYIQNARIQDSLLDTKDAFWHAKNVTITDCIVKGEYLGWYSENLHLIRCKIVGTQPLCYAKGLVLESCEMIDCDLAFENSDVTAEIVGSIDSVKNPKSGLIRADQVSRIILDQETTCIIEQRIGHPYERCLC